jgi:Protein of unknown function (DUF2946)
MDDIVRQAMAKWPNVPDCYGWLGLSARGNWYMRDDRAQAAGAFATGGKQAKGSRLEHEKLIAFIDRNYMADAQGRWYFQNGPQRVFVELEITPYIWRVNTDFSVNAHTGASAQVQSCLLDENGYVYLMTDMGFGLIHTQDMVQAAEAVQAGLWIPQACESQSLSARFTFVNSPNILEKQKLMTQELKVMQDESS